MNRNLVVKLNYVVIHLFYRLTPPVAVCKRRNDARFLLHRPNMLSFLRLIASRKIVD